jgi:hypothetical protein
MILGESQRHLELVNKSNHQLAAKTKISKILTMVQRTVL